MTAIARQRLLQRWRNFEKCLPLRGKWLARAAVGTVAAVWLFGAHFGWDRRAYRVYLVHSPGQPYPWNPAPRQGCDCTTRFIFTGHGEVARSIRLGDLVIEVAESDGWFSRRPSLWGPDCH